MVHVALSGLLVCRRVFVEGVVLGYTSLGTLDDGVEGCPDVGLRHCSHRHDGKEEAQKPGCGCFHLIDCFIALLFHVER